MRLQKANDFVESTLKENKLLKPVILFVKKLLSVHGLLDTYTGGLNSYSLMIMLTAVASQSIGLTTSSEYLKEFLNFYRSQETFTNYIITVKGFIERNWLEE